MPACSCRCSRIPSRRAGASASCRRSAGARRVDDGRGLLVRAAAAAQRDGRRPELAVLGAERDGDRSDLHRAGGGARDRGARRRGACSTPASARSSRRRGAQRRSTTVASARSRRRRSAPPSPISSSTSGSRERRARAAAAAFPGALALVARRLHALSRAARAGRRPRVDASGTRRSAIAIPRRCGPRARSSPARSSSTAYLQWLAAEQWERGARRRPRSASSAIFRSWSAATAPTSGRGRKSSAWTPRSARRPTRFRETGQDWGFPAYRWDRIAAGGFQWLAARARRNAELYDAYRVDHLVGFFRTYVREARRARAVRARRRARATRQGERVLEVLSAPGARLIAEDLGVIPTFVRETLDAPRHSRLQGAALGARMGRATASRSRTRPPIRDASVATSGTHDTETRRSGGTRRRPTSAAPSPRSWARRAGAIPARRSTAACATRSSTSFSCPASDIALVPIHDVFGWRERINTPALVERRQLDLASAVAGRRAAEPSDRRRAPPTCAS